ncbi:hypothetical protein AVEN_94112-1 [Araneus ventricosus]|uniref:Uncharacterized protein n=1 Tax=Araneus ventricosus TaxID=182803 RepID=A0A4Y2MTR2_ARAVE|nr:hypothetical protein AVEN_94112-1 [Araneus ventricosus]
MDEDFGRYKIHCSEVTSSKAMRMSICHSNLQCKCEETIFPHVNSMVGRKKQVVGGDNGSNLDLSLEFKMTCVQFYNYVKEESDRIKKAKSALKYDWAKKD